MRACLAHRGPDGGEIWIEGVAGLGQLMLHTTPESLHERLPWKDLESGLVITADARIDNREELASALNLDRSVAAGLPDSQIILAAFRRWGNSCAGRLLGDFAFAIWDGRNRSLYLARDHMGVRPMYYYRSGSVLVFASSASAVVTPDIVPAVLNEERIADFLAGQLEGVNDSCTFFKHVRRLPPAHFARYSGENLETHRYWLPDVETELRLDSDEAYADAFEGVLTQAVDARLRAVGAPAAMVSGGIDSSTIACIGGKLLRERDDTLRTYSGVSNDESTCRESRNIRRVLECGGFESRLLLPKDVGGLAAGLNLAGGSLEDPFDAHCILLQMIYLQAREDGSVVVLDGLDGDGIASLTSIYPTYLLRAGRWLEAIREVRNLRRNYYRQRSSLWSAYVNAVKPLLAPATFWEKRWKSGVGEMVRNAVDKSYLSGELAGRVNLAARFGEFLGHYHAGMAKSLRHNHARRVVAPFLTAAIERYGRLAACCGVESRHPLLDKRVVEFCIALPWQQKARDGWSKIALRRVAGRHVPGPVAWRRGWDAIGGKFLDAWHNLNHYDHCERLQHLPVEFSAWIDTGRVSRARGVWIRPEGFGEMERSVLNLTHWLDLQQDHPAAGTAPKIRQSL
jgi:asparagine synthase (glutamine-hydrolysing)